MRSRPSVLFAILLLALTSCGSPPAAVPTPTPTEATAAPRYPLVVTDDRGKQITFTAPVQRIVSVAPSST